jgi:hypothetical protein
MNIVNTAALLLATCLLALALVGCTPPYPTRKQTIAPGGVIQNVPDPGSVRPGISRRDEVLSAFKQVDTGVSSRWFFWGRWESSSVSMRVLTDMGLEEARLWKLANFLVEFDDTGTVTKTAILSDNRIISELARILEEHPNSTEATSAPLALIGQLSTSKRGWCYSNIVVSPSTIEFSMAGHGQCSSHLSLPLKGLTVGAYAAPRGEGANIALIRFTLRYSGKMHPGSGHSVSLKPNDLFSLLRFFVNLGSSASEHASLLIKHSHTH